MDIPVVAGYFFQIGKAIEFGQISSRPQKHEFSPQMVVKSKGNPLKFQGNLLGWWTII